MLGKKWLSNMVKDFQKWNLPLFMQNDRLWGMRGSVGSWTDGRKTLFNQGLFEQSTTAKERLGTKRELDDGRCFKYCSTTAAALVAGHCIAKAQTGVACTVAAADALLTLIGAREISLTTAGATANLYADGWLIATTAVNIGRVYKVRGNGATDGIGSGRAAITLYDKLDIAWTAAGTTAWIHQNHYKNLFIRAACTAAGTDTDGNRVMGVTIAASAGSAVTYQWVQTRGIGGMQLDVAAAAGAQDYECNIIPGPTAGRGALVAASAVNGIQVIAENLEFTDLVNSTAYPVYITLE